MGAWTAPADPIEFRGVTAAIGCVYEGVRARRATCRATLRCPGVRMNAHAHHGMHAGHGSLNRLTLAATVHCLTGCGIGEVLGMVISTWLGWSNTASIVLSVALAFFFGYALAMRPLLAGGLALGAALRLALASDTISIVVMEIIDTALLLVIPGAMDAHITDSL